MLSDRDENEVFTLFIPDTEDQGGQNLGPFTKEIQHALGRQTTRHDLADHPTADLHLLQGDGSSKRQLDKKSIRPSQLRLYLRDAAYGMNLHYDLRGKR